MRNIELNLFKMYHHFAELMYDNPRIEEVVTCTSLVALVQPKKTEENKL